MYKRVVLKISGEALSSPGKNIDFGTVSSVAEQVADVAALGIDVCIVIGGGNIWRGRSGLGMDRTTADHMGMLATVINSLAMQNALENIGVPVRLQTAITISKVAEPYIRKRASRHLEKGRVVIFACGTGNPYFSTDTGAALRAAEMEADCILLAKNVDGIYSADPKLDTAATKFTQISYLEVIELGLSAMDTTAITLCMENKIPISVFALEQKDGIKRAAMGENLGTLIS